MLWEKKEEGTQLEKEDRSVLNSKKKESQVDLGAQQNRRVPEGGRLPKKEKGTLKGNPREGGAFNNSLILDTKNQRKRWKGQAKS